MQWTLNSFVPRLLLNLSIIFRVIGLFINCHTFTSHDVNYERHFYVAFKYTKCLLIYFLDTMPIHIFSSTPSSWNATLNAYYSKMYMKHVFISKLEIFFIWGRKSYYVIFEGTNFFVAMDESVKSAKITWHNFWTVPNIALHLT